MLGSDHVVRRTIRKDAHHKNSLNDRVRAIAKWVAVGGGAAAGIIGPVVGALDAATGGMFLLCDPQLSHSVAQRAYAWAPPSTGLNTSDALLLSRSGKLTGKAQASAVCVSLARTR